MNNLLAIAVQNTIVAGLLAVLVYGLTRVWRRPPVAHLLWLLVLAKLVGPPILPGEWLPLGHRSAIDDSRTGDRERTANDVAASAATTDRTAGSQAAADSPGIGPLNDESIAATSGDESASSWKPAELFENLRVDVELYADELQEGILGIWFGGIVLCGSISLYRALRFQRLVQGTLVAPQKLQTITAELAGKLGLPRVPDVRQVERCSVPLVWCWAGKAIIVLPRRLVLDLDVQQMSLVLAHELAHLRRRDHWIRGAEIAISTIYWWNPLVWWVRRQLHEAEELCCDAWVDWMYPESQKRYAEVLFQAATLVDGLQRTPSLACSFLNAATLKGRIEAVLAGRLSRRPSRKSALALGVAALLLLPSFVQSVPSAATASSLPRDAAASPAKPKLGKVVGTVTVEGTGEPVKGATIDATLGTLTGREYDRLASMTDANGHYAIDVPLGNVAFWPWFLRFPPGYWLTDGRANLVTSAAAPVATKNLVVRRGAVWQVRAREAVSEKPVPGIRCTAMSLDKTPQMTFAFTNSDGIVSATLSGFHGGFQLLLFDSNHRGQYEQASVSLTIDAGFHADRIAQIADRLSLPHGVDIQPQTVKLTDSQGKTATVQGARVTRVDGKVLLDVDLVPTASDGTSAVQGTVIDERGQPIAGARVEPAQSNTDGTGFITGMAATTASDGGFEIASAGIRSGGKAALVVTKAGYAGIETPPQSLPDRRDATLDFGRITLLRGKSVRVRVLDADGKPAVGAWVEPRGGYAVNIQSSSTDEGGECVLRDLPKGLVKVYVTFGDLYANGTAIAIDDPSTVTLHLKPFPKRSPATTQNEPHPLELGTPAPDLAVADWSDGKTRRLADYRGKVVLLDFWGVWCGPCVKLLPTIQSLEAKYKGRDVAFLMIHTAGTEMNQIREFARQTKFQLATALDAGDDVNDGATSKRYGVRGYPTVFLVGRDGRIAWRNVDVTLEIRKQGMKRAAQALSIRWPFDGKQPPEKLADQINRIREFLFSEAIDQALAKP